MTIAQWCLAYLTLNLLIVTAYLGLRLFAGVSMSQRRLLQLHYGVVAAVLVMTALHPVSRRILPTQPFYEPPVKVWSASSMKSFQKEFDVRGRQLGFLKAEGHSFPISSATLPALCVFLLVMASAIWRLAVDVRRILALRSETYLARRIGKVSVLVHPTLAVPLSFWLPKLHAVVVPESLLTSRLDFRMAVSHELQHHRQKDTRWAYLFSMLRFFCFPNPAVHLWFRWIAEIQEFACDETLVDRRKVESRQYVRCLIEVAQSSLRQRGVPARATGITFLVERSLLKRRIEAMFESKPKSGIMMPALVPVALIALMAVTAMATQGLVQDRRISRVEAARLAENAKRNSQFPIVMNDLVLKQLNRYVGTPEGREYIRESLARMQSYRPMIEEKLKEYQMPLEILAVPLIESGYQNLADKNKIGWGAGLWMFMKQTARSYGLRVDKDVDERMNVEKLTDAAMRLLKSDFYRFQDWQLSAMAYNMGENALQSAITKTGSRDPWVIIRNGFENDEDYLAKLVAAIIIMKNPELFA